MHLIHASRELAARFEAYGDWRRRLSAGISGLHEWLTQQDLADAQIDHQGPAAARAAAPGQAGRRVRRRVLARQVRAHQRDLLRRLRTAPPAVVGRAHDDVPDRAPLRRVARRRRSACCRSRRGSRTRRSPEFKNYADEWVTFPLDLSLGRPDERGARPRVAGEARAGRRSRASTAFTATRTSSRRSTPAARARSTFRAGATRSSTSRIRCCSRASSSSTRRG